jgi:hypothetical protein
VTQNPAGESRRAARIKAGNVATFGVSRFWVGKATPRVWSITAAPAGENPVLLLRILHPPNRGVITEDRVPLSDELARSFRRHLDVVRERDDHERPEVGIEPAAGNLPP